MKIEIKKMADTNARKTFVKPLSTLKKLKLKDLLALKLASSVQPEWWNGLSIIKMPTLKVQPSLASLPASQDHIKSHKWTIFLVFSTRRVVGAFG